MKTTTKMSLFGGALLFAGVVTGSVNAAEFVFSGGVGDEEAYAYLSESSGLTHSGGFSGGTPTTAYAFIFIRGIDADAYMAALEQTIEGYLELHPAAGLHPSDGYTNVYINNFTVDANATASATWDFLTPGGGTASALFQIEDLTNGGFLVNESTLGTSGSSNISLVAGDSYRLTIELASNIDFSFTDASLSASLNIIPTPGAMALLGAAGLVTRRKRRRN